MKTLEEGLQDGTLQDFTLEAKIKKYGEAYMLALSGPRALGRQPKPNDPIGCSDVGFDSLFSDVSSKINLELGSELAARAETLTQADARVVAVLKAWSACMQERGFTYQTPMEAKGRKWPPTPTAEELATAQSDVACKESTDFVRIWRAVETAYQKELIKKNIAALKEVEDAHQAINRKAEETIRNGTSGDAN